MRTTQRILTVLISGLTLGSSVAAAESCFALVEKVAFSTNRDNGFEIYLMNPDGSDPERITNNPWGDVFAVLSPDGKKFVFDSNRLRDEATEPPNTSDLFVMATDGSEQTHLIRGSSASWAPDSKHITFHRSASGTGLPIRTDPGAPTTDSDIFIVNVDDLVGGTQTPLNITNSPNLIDEDADWSPDGQKIVYAAHVVGDDPPEDGPFVYPTSEIYVVNVDGLGGPQKLTDNTTEERAPAWSPDGTKIALMCRIGPKDTRGADTFELCVMNPDGSGLVRVTNNTVQELGARWSVDGTKLFFNRPVSGRNQLFSINVDGTGETQLTNTLGVNLAPTPGLLRIHTDCP